MARVIIIAGASLALAAELPADIDAQLVTATGCGIDELDELLSAGPDRAALALMPILEPVAEAVEPVDPDTPDRMTAVARLIAADPAAIGAIRGAYADLLSNIVPPDRPKPEETAS